MFGKIISRLMPPLALCLLLVSCSGVQVEDYAAVQPVLSAETFFDGEITAHGIIKNRGGKVTRTFNADIIAYWKDGVGTLEEDFVYDDGETQRRVWTLTRNDDGSYTGRASDVIGDAVMHVAGNSAFLEYTLRVPYKGDTIDVRVDDRMYLTAENALINEATMHKFGLRVGAIQLVMVRKNPDVSAPLTGDF